MILPYKDHVPQVDDSAFIADNATVEGKVTIAKNASVWFGAVLRGDLQPITVGDNSNVQDNAVLHNAHLGERVTVGHAAVVDRCQVGDDCLIGSGANLLRGAAVGRGCLIAAGAVVTGDMVIPPDSLVMGVPARIRGTVTDQHRELIRSNWERYIQYSKEELPTIE